ncbi:hypothetical protein [Streptomyces bungoensis]|uniref:hypothetical protein n=1 Tax=Streptomyces bungoensis TaxID=285568 RepID=UPI001428B7FE
MRIDVADDGPGVPETFADELFQPGRRAEPGDGRDGHGGDGRREQGGGQPVARHGAHRSPRIRAHQGGS